MHKRRARRRCCIGGETPPGALIPFPHFVSSPACISSPVQPCQPCPARARGAAVHVYIYSIAPTPPSSNSPLRPSGMNAPWCGRMRSVLACTLLLSVVRTTRAASECAADGGLCAADASLTLDPANAPPALLEAAREAQLFVSGLYHALHRCAALLEPVRFFGTRVWVRVWVRGMNSSNLWGRRGAAASRSSNMRSTGLRSWCVQCVDLELPRGHLLI